MAASYTRAASQWLCRAQGVCCTKRCAVSKSRAASRLISFASGAKACRRCAQLLVVSNRGNKLQGQRCAHCLRAKGTSWAKGSSTTLWVGSAWVCCRCCAMRVRMACHCIGGLLRRLAWGLVGRFSVSCWLSYAALCHLRLPDAILCRLQPCSADGRLASNAGCFQAGRGSAPPPLCGAMCTLACCMICSKLSAASTWYSMQRALAMASPSTTLALGWHMSTSPCWLCCSQRASKRW